MENNTDKIDPRLKTVIFTWNSAILSLNLFFKALQPTIADVKLKHNSNSNPHKNILNHRVFSQGNWRNARTHATEDSVLHMHVGRLHYKWNAQHCASPKSFSLKINFSIYFEHQAPTKLIFSKDVISWESAPLKLPINLRRILGSDNFVLRGSQGSMLVSYYKYPC